MTELLLLTNSSEGPDDVLPGLSLLSRLVTVGTAEARSLTAVTSRQVVLIDGRRELPRARALCQEARRLGLPNPLLAIVSEGGMTAVSDEWQFDDVLADTASPAEVDARVRLARTRRPVLADDAAADISCGGLLIDMTAHVASFDGRALPLTYKEFELLRYLVTHAGRVVSRQELLRRVWGRGEFGSMRTVDVHVRRIRAKLGPLPARALRTVRCVGYRFDREVLEPLALAS